MRYLCALTVAALFAGGCSLTKTADEMKASTNRIKDMSDHLSKRTDDLESELTFKETSYMMTINMQWLFGEADAPADVVRAEPGAEPDLLYYAGVTIKAMWFQFWKNDFNEDMNALDERLALGAEILFTRAITHTPHDAKVDVLNPDRSYKGIASLGAKLDFTRPEFARVTRAAGLGDLTFYDVVVEALKNRGQMERHERFPQAAAKILQYEREATYMLQLRHNYLPLMVVARMTDLSDRGDLARVWMVLKGQKVDLSKFNPEELKEWTRWLNQAAGTRADLRAMGIEPQYNSTFRRILNAVDFGQKDLLSASSEAKASDLEKLRREFAQAYVDAATAAK